MVPTKFSDFPKSDVQLASWAKALGHPARLAILRTLAEKNECVCGDLVDELPLAQATVSQHLKVLKETGFIQGTIDGPRVCYCLDAETIEQAQEAFGALLLSPLATT